MNIHDKNATFSFDALLSALEATEENNFDFNLGFEAWISQANLEPTMLVSLALMIELAEKIPFDYDEYEKSGYAMSYYLSPSDLEAGRVWIDRLREMAITNPSGPEAKFLEELRLIHEADINNMRRILAFKPVTDE